MSSSANARLPVVISANPSPQHNAARRSTLIPIPLPQIQKRKRPVAMFSSLQKPRQAAAQLMNFALILSTAFMMWKGISVAADSSSPIVVVLSGSMEPAFQRGDLLILWNRNVWRETAVGEVVVYNVKGKDIPIVHRVVRKFGVGDKAKLLTKGDNNVADDTDLYARGQDYLERGDIIGSVVGYVPFVGYVTIMLTEHPWLKTAMLGIMGVLVVLQRE
ncbi:Signal peptidase complex catalytic subunit SEC11 [Tolypocladium capitatum]|uniref:Signal peptidase complex catalytic subunit SEC11 n=1 Tax=Tolypocladium capitatum TaxID=45235 RepID=A0A2K3QKQ2_9HYPO|nr:Signal peptidase complex catalytic subunit SEC11 [Tolypocladium capitatum]